MRRLSLFVILLVLVAVVAGCGRGIGARRLPVDRMAYLEALTDSWKDQVLYNIVKLRYGEPPMYLDIISIIQAYQLQAGGKIGYTYGWKPPEVKAGEEAGSTTNVTTLTPPSHQLSAEVSGHYLTTPTVTYQPISGEAMKESLLKPIPTDDICRALQTGWYPQIIIPHVVQSMNNLKPGDPDFRKFVEIFTKLKKDDVLQIAFEEVEEIKPPEMGKRGEATAKADKWGESAGNLAKFTSKLVKEQDKLSEEKTKAPFIILNRDRAIDKKMEPDLQKFKEILGLVSVPKDLEKKARGLLNAKPLDRKKDLKKKARGLLNVKPLDGKEEKEKIKKWLKDEIGLDDEEINQNEKAIGDFLGLTPTGLTSQERENLKSLWGGSPHSIERYQVVSGAPPRKSGLSKIYLTTRSVTQVIKRLSHFVDFPPSHQDKIYGTEVTVRKEQEDYTTQAKEMFQGLPHIEICYRESKPNPNEFAAVKYRDLWFYIKDTDINSKHILSSMIGIFTMMPTGKKDSPVLTLPVR